MSTTEHTPKTTPVPIDPEAPPFLWLPEVYVRGMATSPEGSVLLERYAAEAEAAATWKDKATRIARERAGYRQAVANAARRGEERPSEPPSEADYADAKFRAETHLKAARDAQVRILEYAHEHHRGEVERIARAKRAQADKLRRAYEAAEREALTAEEVTRWTLRIIEDPSLLGTAYRDGRRVMPPDPRGRADAEARRLLPGRLMGGPEPVGPDNDPRLEARRY